ncbi:wd-40 repeat protein [Stylonychia lemnae]|uniref:Wd-40 repeat protein n=1 Tax=Stylonychia lemnae TaxID=5949 RepID=A0A078A689_STYLE|nr:wd-40 repeat protein [Stylonychia lemnae]|eukprot:CDW77719.1 wd-40 repeat protein [Stylonychia lemnae]
MQDSSYKGEFLPLDKCSGLKLFKLVEIINNCKIQILLNFMLTEFKQSFKFSKDLRLMIDLATYELYQRVEYAFDNNIFVWQQLTYINNESNNWKYNLNNSIVSPDLLYYIDFEVKNKKYQIKKTVDSTVYKEITIQLTDQSNLNQFIYLRWVDNRQIALLHDEGIEKTIDIINNFQETNFRVLNKDAQYGTNKNIDNGFYINIKPFHLDDVEKKLLSNQNQFLLRQQNQLKGEELGRLFQEAMIEFQYSWCDHYMKYLPMIEFSFTHYHWMLALKIINDHQHKIIKQISLEDLKMLLLQVFPDGNTFLHKIANRNEVLEAVSLRINKDFQFLFIKNPEGLTPLHMCLGTRNYFAIDIFVKLLSNHKFYQHSFNIVDILPKLITTELPSLKQYLTSRVIQTQILHQYKRAAIKFHSRKHYAINLTNLWTEKDLFHKQYFETGKLETDVKIMLIDLPKLNIHADQTSQELFLALSKCQELDIFEVPTVQYLIDFQWMLTKQSTLYYLYLPSILNHIVFFIYSNFIINDDKYSNDFQTEVIFLSVIMTFQGYFFINEVRQMSFTKLNYFKSIKNLLDMLQVLTTSATVMSHYKYNTTEQYASLEFLPVMHSCSSLLLWINFLYFLRLFDSTSYLIRILINVFWDMKWFLILLLICQIGFAEAFLRLSEYSQEDGQFLSNIVHAFIYAFRMSIVDNDTSAYDKNVSQTTIWILFIVAGIIMPIVMLNLLISIISKSFDDINKQSKLAAYQEKAKIIFENAFVIPTSANKKEDAQKFITIFKKISSGSNSQDQKKLQKQEILGTMKLIMIENSMMREEISRNKEQLKGVNSQLNKLEDINQRQNLRIERMQMDMDSQFGKQSKSLESIITILTDPKQMHY